MKIFLVKQLDGSLRPAHNSDYDKVKRLKAGESYQCEVKQTRNYEFLQKFFALINMIFDNQEIYKNVDHLRADLIVEAGYYEEWVDVHGEIKRKAKSISFGKMSESEFQELYSRVVDVIIKYFHFDREDIAENVMRYF